MAALDVQSEAVRPSLTGSSRGLVRWVCTSNPFYVLSALLVCLGLWVSFGSQVEASQTWALLFGMSGYTLLLAVTACLLVRFVGVWDDVRTVLLLVVLMFLALSVTFDEVLADDQTRGIICYLAGLLFSVIVSEGVFHAIGLRMPMFFRAPYYMILALFFLYPLAITPLLDQPHSEALSWLLFGFSPAGGLLFLTLIPAIRRGRGYVCDNGSPWGWAWYPWTLFGVLAFGVAARSALLAWSMHHIPSDQTEPYIFGPYFLVPFGLAIGLILLEIGLVEQRKGVLRLALAVPALLLTLTVVGHRADPVYQWFLARFIARLGGTPLYVTLLVSAGFYAFAAVRRAPLAFDALTATVLALAFVAPHTLDLNELTAPQALPILAVAIAQMGIGLNRQKAWRTLFGAGCFVLAAMTLTRELGAGNHQGPISFHVILAAVLLLGALFEDRLGHVLRITGATAAVVGSLAVITGRVGQTTALPSWVIEVYPLVMALMIAGYGYMVCHRFSLLAAGLILSACLVAACCRGYNSLRHVVAGIDYIAIGLVMFSLAVLTSMAKGGVLPWRIAGKSGEVVDTPD
jgi:hypothetical protein